MALSRIVSSAEASLAAKSEMRLGQTLQVAVAEHPALARMPRCAMLIDLLSRIRTQSAITPIDVARAATITVEVTMVVAVEATISIIIVAVASIMVASAGAAATTWALVTTKADIMDGTVATTHSIIMVATTMAIREVAMAHASEAIETITTDMMAAGMTKATTTMTSIIIR